MPTDDEMPGLVSEDDGDTSVMEVDGNGTSERSESKDKG